MMLRKQPTPNKRTGRLRCPAHLKFVREHYCLVDGCYELPVQAAHWRLGAHAGMSQKPDDSRAVPLCHTHHAEAHRGEATFAMVHKLDIEKAIDELCRKSDALKRHRSRMSGMQKG